MAKNNLQRIFENLFGTSETVSLNLDGASPDFEFTDTNSAGIVELNLSAGYAPAAVKPILSDDAAAEVLAKSYTDSSAVGVSIIELRGSGMVSKLEKKPDAGLLRNYAKNSVWVQAAIDYHRRMIGRAKFEITPIDSTEKPTRNDKFVRSEVEKLLKMPNESGDSYGFLKEQIVEDYLVLGHGCFELDLYNDLTVRGLRVLDAARIGFVKDWDGSDPSVPRYVQFSDKQYSRIKRVLTHEQVMCFVNRPKSSTKLGYSHVEALHRTVVALLAGDEFLIKQIIQPVVSSLVDLGEGATKQQVDDFKYQLQQVKEALAVIGGSKNTKVHRLAATAEEMKILDGCEWFVRQVAAIFGISTAKLKLAVDTSRANTESMFDDDLEAVTGELTRLEELETATLINRYSYKGEINLEFSYPIMHRKDEKQQAVIAQMQTKQPWASTNEARARTGEKPLDQKKYPYADEPLIVVSGIPVPHSIWTLEMQEREKNVGKTPDAESGNTAPNETGAADANADTTADKTPANS